MGVNCLAPYLLTKLVEPLLIRTAAISNPLSVRIVFVVTLMQLGTPCGAMAFTKDGHPVVRESAQENYRQSKAGASWLADDFAKRFGPKGILSVVREYELCHDMFRLLMKIELTPWNTEDGDTA